MPERREHEIRQDDEAEGWLHLIGEQHEDGFCGPFCPLCVELPGWEE